MKRNSRSRISSVFILTVFVVVILSSACTVNLRPHQTGDLLQVDDFGSRRINWRTWQKPGISSASYLKGGFVLVVESPNMDAITTNGVFFDNLDMKVTAGKIAGPDDNHYGLVCRYQDDSNYYSFLVTSDGYYGVLRVKDGIYQMLSSGSFEFSNAINQKDSENIIHAVCLQDLLVLNVNRQQLAMVTDDSFTTGQVGLIAGTYADPNLAVKFDNFTITYP